MSTLTVHLTPAGTEYDYVLSIDGREIQAQGRASAAMLPAASEVIAVVDVRALSWHSLELPKGSVGARGAQPTPRLRAILEGLLEERVLDEPQQLHFALSPRAKPDAPVCVAACERAWLKAALLNLEGAGRAATRVVPEFAPDLTAQASAWHVIGSPEHAQLVRETAQGVSVLPLDAGSVALALQCEVAGTTLFAEPAVAALAEQWFKRPVQLQQSAQRWLQATLSDWDLAQFDLVSSGGQRTFKKIGQAWRSLLQAPQWRALRWGALALVLVQLLGLNLWAWHEKSSLQARRAAISDVLTQTFPGVKLVVDAPLQMERELAALRQATGSSSGGDLESMLGALAMVRPPNRTLSGVEFSAGEARFKGLALTPEETSSVSARLKGQGYLARAEADALVMQPQARP